MYETKKNQKAAVLLVIVCACLVLLEHQGCMVPIALSEASDDESLVTVSAEEYKRLKRYEKLDEVIWYLEELYYTDIDTDKLLDDAIRGVFTGLNDPYSLYYDVETWKSVMNDNEGDQASIGVQLSSDYVSGRVVVSRVYRDTPAQIAGLHRNDVMVNVSSGDETLIVDADNMHLAVRMLQGEPGTMVHISILRDDEPVSFDIQRETITMRAVETAMLDDYVGLITVYSFTDSGFAQVFNDAVDELEDQGALAMIIDLRDNGGGSVDSAISLADHFLDEKMVYYTLAKKGGSIQPRYTSKGADDIPLVILVNEYSASSSEMVAGALQDYGRAVIVGTQTYGKGYIQYLAELSDG